MVARKATILGNRQFTPRQNTLIYLYCEKLSFVFKGL